MRLNPKRNANAGAHRRQRTVTEVAPTLPPPTRKAVSIARRRGREGEREKGRKGEGGGKRKGRGQGERGSSLSLSPLPEREEGGGKEEERVEGKEGADSESPSHSE